METFYRFLGGPRTFWGGGNKTIINNNFIGGMPFSYGFGRPMPMFGGHYCCGGGVPSAFKWMLGFGLASSIVGGIMNTANQSNTNNVTSYNPYQAYNPYYNPYNNNYNYNYSNQDLSSLTAKVNKLEDDLATYKKQIQELLNNDTQEQNNEVKTKVPTPNEGSEVEEAKKQQETTNTEQPKRKEEINQSQNTPNTSTKEVNNTDNTQNTEEVAATPKKEKQEQKTLDDILNDIGFNNLDNAAKDYVKSRISQVYVDEAGNIKYDIKAVVHDGDNLNAIINRFYTNEEQENLEIAKAKLHTQGSETKLITNPLSGDTITAKGVSEYGLKALMQDAQKGITRQGEITKTNKRISDLKAAFINGQKKLSKAYVLQNKLMTEAEYNKIIQEKYS